MAVYLPRVREIREYIADCKRRAGLHLDQGFASLETAVEIQLLIEHAAKAALECRSKGLEGFEGELVELREISDRIKTAACALELDDIPFELDHGERPPTEEWRWSDYEKVIASSRACGLDVTEAEQVLARARQVAASQARGYDNPEHEEDVRQGRRRSRRAAGLEIATGPAPSVAPASAPNGPAPSVAPARAHIQGPERPVANEHRPPTGPTPIVAPASAHIQGPERPVANEHRPPIRVTEPREAPVMNPAPLADDSAPRPVDPGPQRITEAQPPEAEPIAAPQSAAEVPVVEAESPTEGPSEEAAQQPPSEPESAESTKSTTKASPEPAPPRFSLAADASPEDIQRHFAEVEAAIPPKLIGTATAVELWKAVHEAHRHGALPITGNWVDLVAALHRHGFLPHLPSDRASRAALLILAGLSPLVRRLHHRRWALGALTERRAAPDSGVGRGRRHEH